MAARPADDASNVATYMVERIGEDEKVGSGDANGLIVFDRIDDIHNLQRYFKDKYKTQENGVVVKCGRKLAI
ncbi:hypothetical protein ACFX13_043195 [Malus domestica]